MLIDVDAVRTALETAVDSNWNWSKAGLGQFCIQMGWPVEKEGERSVRLRTGIETGSASALLFMDANVVQRISLRISRRIEKGDFVGSRDLSESFQLLVGQLRKALGDPISVDLVAEPFFRWNKPSVVILLFMANGFVSAELVNPEVQRREDEWDATFSGGR
ncbi:DUF6301 family protein [Nocardia higoensis]|uniref:DUF6301 family protein n=1 Tax=Nocardia higoensis TaxID=228599 RepID=UPI0012F65D91|nr:DUF6301 family protein [Nocardia higoensis]